MSKSQEQNQLFSQNCFLENRNFPKKVHILRKHILSDSGCSSLHIVNYVFIREGLIVKLGINYFQHYVEFSKNYENHVNFKFGDC